MYYLKEKHFCELRNEPSPLGELPPGASYCVRFLRRIRKLCLASYSNGKTRYAFRSSAAVETEQKRQFKMYPCYVIHPFSTVAKYREIYMFWAYIFIGTVDAFHLTFNSRNNLIVDCLRSCCYVSIGMNIGFNFFTGVQLKNKEIVLEPKRFRLLYLKTTFILDLLMILPYSILIEGDSERILHSFSVLLLCVRVPTMMAYLRQITLFFNISDLYHELTSIVIFGIYLMHWMATFLFFVAELEYISEGKVNPLSWLTFAKMNLDLKNVSAHDRYIQCLHKTVAHFFSCGTGMWLTECSLECAVLCVNIISGMFYFAYVTALILELSRSLKISESQYDKLLHQLKTYIVLKRLPPKIRCRLRAYYEHRFKQRYFRQNAILMTVSEHLRYEIILYTCKPFIENVWLFEGMSKLMIGRIVSCLKSEIYLPNDVIYDSNQDVIGLHFIVSGCVSVYYNGNELMHMEDGGHFGLFDVIESTTTIRFGTKPKMSFVASDITEMYNLSKEDFEQYVVNSDSFEVIRNMANRRYEYMKTFFDEEEVFYRQLQSGEILHPGTKRTRTRLKRF